MTREGYAIATCLSGQGQPYLKDQGDRWGAVVIQRGEGPLAVYRRIGDVVKAELHKGGMVVATWTRTLRGTRRCP